MANATRRLNIIGWAAVDKNNPNSVIDLSELTEYTIMRYSLNGQTRFLYPIIGDWPNNLAYNYLYNAKFIIHANEGSGQLRLILSDETIDKNTVTYNTRPAESKNWIQMSGIGMSGEDLTFESPAGDSVAAMSTEAAKLLRNKNGYLYFINYIDRYFDIDLEDLADGSTVPYVEISYDDTETVQAKISVGNFASYVDPRNNSTIIWDYVRNDSSSYQCFATAFEQTSASFFWRVQGGSAWNEVPASGSTKSVTIPANTFPTASTIECYVSGTVNGVTTQSPVQTFSTSAPLVTATPISPINTIEDGSDTITLTWSYSSTDGRYPDRYKLYWREHGETTWNSLYNSESGVIDTSYEVPVDTFPAGTIEWGVQAINIDGIAGTIESATFVCRAAPHLGGLSSDGVPFLTVSWQAEGQLAYEITVDGKIYGPYFGGDKNFTLPDYLKDGTHVIRVRIMGAWNLWSKTESLQVTIANEAGESITLNGYSGPGNELSWETQEQTSDFLIYRNGKAIGHTAQITFTDRFAQGESSYHVVNRLTDGNYSISNEVILPTNLDGTYIALINGGEWLKIKYQLKDSSDQQYEESVETVYNHLAGDDYPSVSISRYRERSLNYSAVFLYVDEADHTAFKNMLRKPVVMKFENGNVIVGVIDSWTVLHRKHYYTAYTFSLRQIEWEDYVDDTT